MNSFKLFFSFFVLFVGALALKNEQTNDSPMLTEKMSDDEEALMKLYENDDEIDPEDENMEDEEHALSESTNDIQLQKRNPIVCAARRLACIIACRRVPFFLRRPCRGLCDFVLRFANRAACFIACRRVHPFLRGICFRLCSCLR